MKYKDFRNTNCFKSADMILYYSPDGKPVELPHRKMMNKEVLEWSFIKLSNKRLNLLYVKINP